MFVADLWAVFLYLSMRGSRITSDICRPRRSASVLIASFTSTDTLE